MRRIVFLATTAFALISSSAMAQDVLMRRPLPVHAGASAPSTGTPTPSGSALPPDVDPTVAYNYQWQTGEWSGSAVCDSQSSMTRTVSCIAYPQYNSPNDTPAGFSENPDGYGYVAPDDYCAYYAGPKPAASYSGTGGGCSYIPITTDDPNDPDVGGGTDWIMPPGETGDVTCSSDAYRIQPYYCVRSDTFETVDRSFCADQIDPNSYLPVQTGNHVASDTCKPQWITNKQNIGCRNEGDYTQYSNDFGPYFYQNWTTDCEYPDGATVSGVDEGACDIDPDRPFDGVQQVTTCTGSWNPFQLSGYTPSGECVVGDDDSQAILVQTIVRNSRPLPQYDDSTPSGYAALQGLYDSCKAQGAKCIGQRYVEGGYKPETVYSTSGSTVQIVCTSSAPVPVTVQNKNYHDVCAQTDPGAGVGCPLFYWNSNIYQNWSVDGNPDMGKFDQNGNPFPAQDPNANPGGDMPSVG